MSWNTYHLEHYERKPLRVPASGHHAKEVYLQRHVKGTQGRYCFDTACARAYKNVCQHLCEAFRADVLTRSSEAGCRVLQNCWLRMVQVPARSAVDAATLWGGGCTHAGCVGGRRPGAHIPSAYQMIAIHIWAAMLDTEAGCCKYPSKSGSAVVALVNLCRSACNSCGSQNKKTQ